MLSSHTLQTIRLAIQVETRKKSENVEIRVRRTADALQRKDLVGRLRVGQLAEAI